MIPYILHITFPNETDTDDFIKTLLENKLAVCCQKIKSESVFSWKGEVNTCNEILILIKTFDYLIEKIKILCAEKHPYDVYQLYGYEMKVFNDEYLKWMRLECRDIGK